MLSLRSHEGGSWCLRQLIRDAQRIVRGCGEAITSVTIDPATGTDLREAERSLMSVKCLLSLLDDVCEPARASLLDRPSIQDYLHS